MKFFFFFLLLDIPGVSALQTVKEFGNIFLRLDFPPVYKQNIKSCCKVYTSGCHALLDSTGYTNNFLRGRVTKIETKSWIVFSISRVRILDGGYYRCAVMGAPSYIYADYSFQVSGASADHNQSKVPLSKTVQYPNTPTSPESTGSQVAQDHSDSPITVWTFGPQVALAVSMSVILVVASVIGAVCFRLKIKPKHLDKCGKCLHESPKQEATETAGVIYTTVDFCHQDEPVELYANVNIQKARTGGSHSHGRAEHDGEVEYSIVALHQ
ncbi:uncharacterized protein LOC129187105 [Dunckerocampus dactyliophorus]|uniref:uncharacterized protein LOC129187105 n=1 Tax=Dunckerocampus dactyliophorus TaxID=161453 RepID=UPI002404D0E1|nr:uncharacterized protein LOC129187105 [Dunckerocampus dactyliophorus]